MKKSELKKRLVEALTPDEAAKVEPKYKETYAAMIKGKGPLKLKKYDNPDKVVRGRVVNTIKNESLKIAEKLGKTAKIDDYIDDFKKSDAKQFQGKSEKKRNQMATAAFLNKEEQKLDEIDNLMNETGQEIAKKNMDDYKRLNELVKAALMGPISEKKQRPDYPDIDGDGDTKEPMVKAAKDKEKSEANEDVVKGSNIKKVGDDWRVLSGKTGKMWKQKYDSKKDAEAALRGYFASQNESLEEDKMTPEERALDRKIRKAYGLDRGAPDPDMPHFKNIFKDDAITIPGLKERILKELRGGINEMKMMDFAKLAKKVKDATEFIEKVASQLGNQSLEGEKALTSMYNSLKTMEESESTIDETAIIKPYPGQTKNNIKANVKSVKTFADEILRHIEAVKAEEPQGDQYVDNPKIKMAITNLKSVAGDQEESLPERILKELRK